MWLERKNAATGAEFESQRTHGVIEQRTTVKLTLSLHQLTCTITGSVQLFGGRRSVRVTYWEQTQEGQLLLEQWADGRWVEGFSGEEITAVIAWVEQIIDSLPKQRICERRELVRKLRQPVS